MANNSFSGDYLDNLEAITLLVACLKFSFSLGSVSSTVFDFCKLRFLLMVNPRGLIVAIDSSLVSS